MRRLAIGVAIAFAGGVLVGWLIPRPEPLGPLVAEHDTADAPESTVATSNSAPTSDTTPTSDSAPTSDTAPRAPLANGQQWPTYRPRGVADSSGVRAEQPASEPRSAADEPNAADWPERDWPNQPGTDEEATLQALDHAEETAQTLDACDGIEVRSVDCSAPPCMVFFSAPGATCLALSNWNHHAAGCPSPLGDEDGGGLVLAAPIVCPDGYRECVRALVPTNAREVRGFEDAEGSDSDRELEILFSMGHRLTQSAPAWACQKD